MAIVGLRNKDGDVVKEFDLPNAPTVRVVIYEEKTYVRYEPDNYGETTPYTVPSAAPAATLHDMLPPAATTPTT